MRICCWPVSQVLHLVTLFSWHPLDPSCRYLKRETVMANRSHDPTQNIVAEFQAGRISRRRFLQLLAAVTGGAAMASVPTVAARNVVRSPYLSPSRQIEPKVLVYGASQDIATLDPFDRVDYSISAIM